MIHDIKKSKYPTDLHLDAYTSAIPFYQKIGAKIAEKQNADTLITTSMIIELEKMNTILTTFKNKGVIASEEPILKEFNDDETELLPETLFQSI